MTGRWVVIFDGPGVWQVEGEGPGHEAGAHVVRMCGDDEGRAAVWPTADAARAAMRGHMMEPFVGWVLNLDTGETQ